MNKIEEEMKPAIRFEDLDPVISTIGLGPWSSSKLKVLQKCPFQFFLKYLLKLKPTSQAPETLSTHVGKAAHAILEKMALGQKMSVAMARTKREFEKDITPAQWEEHVETLEMSFTRFSERVEAFNQKNPIKRAATELRIGITKDWTPTGFFADDVFFRGVIDLIFLLENGDALIIDHKTGAPAMTGLRNYREQLNTYKVLTHYGVEPIKGASSGIHYIRDQEIKVDDYVDAKYIETNLRVDLEHSLESAVDNLKETGFFKHKACNLCKYCDFAVECKAGELKELEKRTIKFFK